MTIGCDSFPQKVWLVLSKYSEAMAANKQTLTSYSVQLNEETTWLTCFRYFFVLVPTSINRMKSLLWLFLRWPSVDQCTALWIMTVSSIDFSTELQYAMKYEGSSLLSTTCHGRKHWHWGKVSVLAVVMVTSFQMQYGARKQNAQITRGTIAGVLNFQ